MTVPSRPTPDTGFLPVLPPRFALVELAIFAAVIAGEYAFDAFPDFSKLNPHPYWIAVLLLSLQYGTVSGLLAAALAIGGTLLLGLPEAEIGESYFNYLVRVWTQPVLWIIVALLLGSFRMRQIEERDGLQRQVDHAIVQSGSLADYARQLKARVEMLERRLAASAKPETAQLLEALDGLANGRTRERQLQAARTVFDIVCPGAAVSLAVQDGGGFRQVFAHNWSATARWRADLKADDPLARAILAERRVFSVLNQADDALLGRDARLVMPIAMVDGKAIAGVLRVEELPAASLDATLIARLATATRHLSPLLTDFALQPLGPPTSVVPMVRRIRSPLYGNQPEPAAATAAATVGLPRPPLEFDP